MKALTVRNIPPELASALQQEAEARGASLNETVIRLLQQELGLQGQRAGKKRYHDLDWFVGTWSEEEAREFDAALAEQRQIEPFDWQAGDFP